MYYGHGGERGPVTFPAFKAVLRERTGMCEVARSCKLCALSALIAAPNRSKTHQDTKRTDTGRGTLASPPCPVSASELVPFGAPKSL
jgi:hypothetical protein